MRHRASQASMHCIVRRQKARKFHPDVNKDPGAEETFKQVCPLVCPAAVSAELL